MHQGLCANDLIIAGMTATPDSPFAHGIQRVPSAKARIDLPSKDPLPGGYALGSIVGEARKGSPAVDLQGRKVEDVASDFLRSRALLSGP